MRVRSLEKAYDARDQLTWIDRLDQVVVGSDQQTARTIKGIGSFAGDEDDCDRVAVAVAERAADLVAVQNGKLNVEDDHGRRLLGDRRHDLGTARERLRRVANPLE